VRHPTAENERLGTREAAFRYCAVLARSHYENFTVGSRLLPRPYRRHVYALYSYCRWVDDLGDEDSWRLDPALVPPPPPGASQSETQRRLELLDWWQSELESCYSGTPTHPVLRALQETIQTFDLPPEPFLKLIEANRLDQRARRYPTYADLLRYCDHSANPVGHLVLYLFGYRDPERQRRSDATCTALQLTNFWQDVARDYQKGRVYLPQEDLLRFGYTEAELAQGVCNDAFRRLLAFQVERATALFQEGAALVPTLRGTAKLDVALFTRGGLAVLAAIRKRDYNVLAARPTLSRRQKGTLFLSTWLGWKLGLGLGLPAGRGDGH
jgi:squalene synthase HpnC